MLVDVVNGADVGMIERRGGLGLAPETLQSRAVPGESLRQELERDESVQPGVFGLVDDAHTPAAQFLEDTVVRNSLAHHRR